MAQCPICQEAAKPRPKNKSFPFCSARCKMVDLGKWMNEEYRIAAEPSEEDEDELSETGPLHEEPVRH